MKDFRSDNVAPVAPEILAAIVAANAGTATAYGDDDLSQRLQTKFAALFERDVTVHALATGTAGNALSLAAITPPWGVLFAHEQAHIRVDECGAPEFFTGGARITGLPGVGGKLAPATLRDAIAACAPHGAHNMQPGSVSLSQSTEAGCVYSADEVAALCEVAHAAGLKVHMDGARLANAVAGANRSLADLTWRAGVDIVSFGATKNGAMAAEAIVCFDAAVAATLDFRRKRAGHLFSKMRFVSAQLDAYVSNDLWLRNARAANAAAARLAAGIGKIAGATVLVPVQANEVFARLPEPTIARLRDRGFQFYGWDQVFGPGAVRLVTAFHTTPADVDGFLHAAAGRGPT